MKYSLKIDMAPMDEALKKLAVDLDEDGRSKAVLAGLFQLEGEAKINIRENFDQKTGHLASDWETKLDNVTETLAEGHTGPLAIYARIQELGGIIRATNAAALVFQTDDGVWHSVKAVTIPARPYLRKAADENKNDVVLAMSNVLRQLIEGK